MASVRSNHRRKNGPPRSQAATVAEAGVPVISRLIFPGVVLLAILIVFSPALENGFVSWDDDKMLLGNTHYRGLGWLQLRWMFTTFYLGHYQPLRWMTLGLDYLLWGMNPFGYHLTNLLLHAANAVFFYFVAQRLLCLAYSISDGAEGLALRAAA